MPGRLSLLAVASGTVLGTMIGISGASMAILAKSLLPEMSRRGYKKAMTLGPIIGSGMLATMIPPSAGAVILGAIGRISIGGLLIAIILPGLLLAFLFGAYIIARCMLQPSLAPSYKVPPVAMREKLKTTVTDILPVSIVIFAVIGAILLGIATPSESAALGVISCFLLAALHKKFNWQVVKRSIITAMETNIMIFFIIAGAISFSRVLALSGAMTGLVGWVVSLQVPPILIIIATQLVVMFMGCFMGPNSIMMITISDQNQKHLQLAYTSEG